LAKSERIRAKKAEKQGFFAGSAFFALRRVILTQFWQNYAAACRAVHAQLCRFNYIRRGNTKFAFYADGGVFTKVVYKELGAILNYVI
jgi:hypothetical protein